MTALQLRGEAAPAFNPDGRGMYRYARSCNPAGQATTGTIAGDRAANGTSRTRRDVRWGHADGCERLAHGAHLRQLPQVGRRSTGSRWLELVGGDGGAVPERGRRTGTDRAMRTRLPWCRCRASSWTRATGSWILDTGSPMFRPTKYGRAQAGLRRSGDRSRSSQTILLRPGRGASDQLRQRRALRPAQRRRPASPTSRTPPIRGRTGSSSSTSAAGEAWRKLHDHPGTKAASPGRNGADGRRTGVPERSPGESTKQVGMGSDGIAISMTVSGSGNAP